MDWRGKVDAGQKFGGREPTANVQLSCPTDKATALHGRSLSLRQNETGIGSRGRLWKPLAAKGECRRTAATG
jgi:hypothetical protein